MTAPLPQHLATTTRCLFTELGDGTAVLLHLDTKFYYTLNPTGVAIWKVLSQSKASLDTLVDHIVEEFEVDEETARADIQTVLSDLLEEELVTSAEG